VSIVLKEIFGPKERKKEEAGEYYILKSFIIFAVHQVLLG
jgi:hypothetical protein